MVGLIVTYTVRPEEADRAAELLREMAAEVRAHEPSCVHWSAFRTDERPDTFHIAEAYVDAAALDAHRATPHFERLVVQGFRPLATSREAVTGELLD